MIASGVGSETIFPSRKWGPMMSEGLFYKAAQVCVSLMDPLIVARRAHTVFGSISRVPTNREPAELWTSKDPWSSMRTRSPFPRLANCGGSFLPSSDGGLSVIGMIIVPHQEIGWEVRRVTSREFVEHTPCGKVKHTSVSSRVSCGLGYPVLDNLL